MTLDYLDFDYSEDDEGTGTFDAMACVTEAQWARLQHEITQVLQWCHEQFPEGPKTDIVGVGAAIRQPDGRVIAFNAGGAASKFPRELLEQEVGPQLARMVKGLESFVRSDEV